MGNHKSLGCVSLPRGDDEFNKPQKRVQHRGEERDLSHSSCSSATLSISSDSNTTVSSLEYPYYQTNVKILFLDVDGVLNNPHTLWHEPIYGIDSKLLKYLKLIILKTNCKIVLSTTWRLNENAKSILMHTMKVRADIDPEDIIIGETKNLKHRNKHRTHEIYDFLKSNPYRYNVVSWCALDDLALDSYDAFSKKLMNGHFVRTNPKVGISPQNALQCIEMLNKNDYNMNPYLLHYGQRYVFHR